MITTRAATIDDVRTFYPEAGMSFKAWVAELDGEVQGIIGVALGRTACVFSQFNESLRPCLKNPAILRLIKKTHHAVMASLVPVMAVEEDNEPTSRRILERLGFRYKAMADGRKIYLYAGGVN